MEQYLVEKGYLYQDNKLRGRTVYINFLEDQIIFTKRTVFSSAGFVGGLAGLTISSMTKTDTVSEVKIDEKKIIKKVLYTDIDSIRIKKNLSKGKHIVMTLKNADTFSFSSEKMYMNFEKNFEQIKEIFEKNNLNYSMEL